MGFSIRRWVFAVTSLFSLAGLAVVVVPTSTTEQGRRLDPTAAPLVGPQAAEVDWLARVQRELAHKEYEATRSSMGLQAPNRAHNLRTYFDASGIQVHDRTAAESPELFGLSLSGMGRPERMNVVQPGEVANEGARVEIRRPGVVEWYANSQEGLEQGFTVSERLAGPGPLVLELAVEGAWAAQRGDGAILQAATGRPLRYGSLTATDAKGRTLVAQLEVPEVSRIRLVVEDTGAVFPVVIDPLLTATSDAQLESEQESAYLGISVAGAGDVNGDAYDDVIVGADCYDAGEANEGAAFVFLGSAAGIADGDPTTAAVILQSNQEKAWLGESVAGAGDVNGDGYDDVIVGARGYDADRSDAGAAYVFLGSAAGVSSIFANRIVGSGSTDWLGTSVAGAGDVNGDGYDDVIVGAPRYNADRYQGGGAFVFLGSSTGIIGWNPASAATRLGELMEYGELGGSVAGAGDVNGDGYDDVIVGAKSYGVGGAAFLFLGSASGIADGGPNTAATVIAIDQPGTYLGSSVAGAGDVNGDGYDDVIVGARDYLVGYDDEEEVITGAAFVFLGSDSGIASGDPTTADSQLESDEFGTIENVAGAGDVNGDGYDDVIVGAPYYYAGEEGEGAAFLFLGSASGIADGDPTTADARLDSDQARAYLGISVAGAGDVNGDGYDDIIVGAFWYDAGEADEGAAFVSLGSPTPRPRAPLTKEQQGCVNAMNRSGEKVNKAQLMDNEKCLRDYQKNGLTTSFQLCTAADRKGKIQKAKDKTVTDEDRTCNTLAVSPPFAYTDGATVNQSAIDGALALTHAIFGGPPVQDSDLATTLSNKGRAECQLGMLTAAGRLESTILKEANNAEKKAIGEANVSAAWMLENALTAILFPNGRISRAEEQLKKGVEAKCASLQDPSTIFPGACAHSDLIAIEHCVIAAARCHACLMINAFDDLDLGCDDWDDGDARNGSCP